MVATMLRPNSVPWMIWPVLAAVAEVAEGNALFFGIGLEGVVSRDIRDEAHADETVVEGIFGRFTVVGLR